MRRVGGPDLLWHVGAREDPLCGLSRGDAGGADRTPAGGERRAEAGDCRAAGGGRDAQGREGPAEVKPSGMEKGTEPEPADKAGTAVARSRKSERLTIHEERVIKAEVPAGSRFKGYEDFLVQDLVLRPHVIRIRRERWLTPDGQTVTAPMPTGITGHFGPELRRFVLFQYHQGQVTVPRLVAQLRAIGIVISKRQVVRLLNEGQAPSSTKRATCCGPAWRRRAGSASTTPAPATSTRTASAPSSATTTSPPSPPPARRAG